MLYYTTQDFIQVLVLQVGHIRLEIRKVHQKRRRVHSNKVYLIKEMKNKELYDIFLWFMHKRWNIDISVALCNGLGPTCRM